MATVGALRTDFPVRRSDDPAARPARLADTLRNLLMVSVPTIILCVLGVEVPLRMAGYGQLEIYQSDPVLFWRLKANQHGLTKVGRQPFHVNAHGTRGPEFDAIKPAGTIRVLSLGDSRTFGWGLSDGETYSALIEAKLRERIRGASTVEVINAGVNAWSYPQMTAYFRVKGLTYAPDFVLVGGANEWTQFTEHADPAFSRRMAWRVTFKNLLRRSAIYHYVIEVKLEKVYQQYRTRFIPVQAGNAASSQNQGQRNPASVFKRAIQDLCRRALARGVTPVLVYFPLKPEIRGGERTPYYDIQLAVARELAVPFVDVTPALRRHRHEVYLDADPVHLNAAGNRVIADELVEVIQGLMNTGGLR